MEKKFKSYLLKKKGKISIIESSFPKLGKDEILVKVIYTGMCGSDLSVYLEKHPYKKPPIVCGHEMVGEVIKFGKNVTNLKQKDIISILPYDPCNKCSNCKLNKFNFCKRKKIPGYDMWNGTFSNFFIARKNSIFKVNKKIKFLDAVLLEPLAISNHAVELIDRNKETKSCLIIGAGSVGLTVLMNLIHDTNIKTIGCIDKFSYKEKITKKIGADYFIKADNNKKIKSKIKSLTKSNGIDLIFLCTSYSNCIDDAIEYINENGQLIIVSYFDKKSMKFNINKMISKEVNIKGSYLSNLENFKKSSQLILNKKITPSEIISHILPLEKTDKAFKMLLSSNSKTLKVILKNEEKN